MVASVLKILSVVMAGVSPLLLRVDDFKFLIRLHLSVVYKINGSVFQVNKGDANETDL